MSHSDVVFELKSVINEKNKIIDDLKFLLSQKESLILSMESRSKGNTFDHPPLNVTNPIPFSTTNFPVHHTSDHKDELIKDLLHIISQQLDWRKVHTSNPIVKKYLTPTLGKYRFDDGEYEGDLLGGQPNGQGRTTLDNGDYYSGGYLHGKKNAVGIYRWRNGDVYEGDHLDGQEHGKGLYKYADGDIYVGDYYRGKRHGFGILKLKSGTTEYGHFSDGHYNGKCIMVSPDEQVVSIGDLKDNKQDGNWKFYNMRETQVFVMGSKIA